MAQNKRNIIGFKFIGVLLDSNLFFDLYTYLHFDKKKKKGNKLERHAQERGNKKGTNSLKDQPRQTITRLKKEKQVPSTT